MRKRLSPLGLALGLSLALVSAALARPVTTKDLAGRTICYDNGPRVSYLPNGKYENSRFGNGTWKVTPGGVQINAQSYSGLEDIEIRSDGAFSITGFSLVGRDCK